MNKQINIYIHISTTRDSCTHFKILSSELMKLQVNDTSCDQVLCGKYYANKLQTQIKIFDWEDVYVQICKSDLSDVAKGPGAYRIHLTNSNVSQHFRCLDLDIWELGQYHDCCRHATRSSAAMVFTIKYKCVIVFHGPLTRHAKLGCACAGNVGSVFPATDFKGNR